MNVNDAPILRLLGRAYFFFFFLIFICLFLAALGLHCWAQAFPSCNTRGLLFIEVVGFSLRWLLLLQSTGSRHVGSVVTVLGLSFPVSCGIFLDQRSNPCPLPWQADSYPLDHQGSLGRALFCMGPWEDCVAAESQGKVRDGVPGEAH